MAKKKLKFTYDAPVTLTFSLACIVIALVDTFILKNYLAENILLSPTSSKGLVPFSFSEIMSYPRILLYVFSAKSMMVLLVDLTFILLLGPSIEEYYGSVIVGIMIAVSIIVSGVLNSCFCMESLRGPAVIVFIMILLHGFIALSKRNISISFIVVFLMYFTYQLLINKSTGLGVSFATILVNIAGGLCGSIFAFFASPKARAVKRNNSRNEADVVSTPSPKKKRTNRTPKPKALPKKKSASKKNDDATIALDSSDSEDTIVGNLDI